VNDARFIQIHALQSYPAALLNRDDSGLAKRLPFGGVTRTRISSQCLKRHWRMAEDDWSLRSVGAPLAWRSREVVERRISPKLDESGVATPEIRKAACDALVLQLYGKSGKEVRNRQALLLGDPEIAYLTQKLSGIASAARSEKEVAEAVERMFRKDEKANLSAMLEGAALNAGLEAALFGRMVTSDPEANTDAAIHVAHAFTVHAEESENDYFTVVDDLTREAGEPGTAGLFDTELTSGLYYSYAVVDVPKLRGNLGDDGPLAAKVIEHLVHLIATVSPGAKLGSTAPYGYAELMLVETGRRQPRTLAGAYRSPVAPTVDAATKALAEHLAHMDGAYGLAETRQHLALAGDGLPGSTGPISLDALAAFAAATVDKATA
jgi:CRISPR system Cascade subunit CasC